ncbi:MAG: hypothetical protein P8H13_00770 [Polaribacter sp.]|nr:hypothetical protein [Polaribacter sp.]MDG1810452.1 hypothetical protein [Polaribacter sp.]MDG1993894.1 hypothetical protein [Polaribacter sp.]
MKIRLTFILLLNVVFAFGQELDNNLNHLVSSNSLTTFANYDTSIKGSPFVQENYEDAKISKLDKRTFSTMYNAHRDFMEILKDGGTQYFLPSKKYPYQVVFLNSNKTYKAYSFKDKKGTKYGFFKLATNNTLSNLLVREEIILKDAIKPKTGYGEYTPSKFNREKDTFFINFTKNDIAISLSKKKKSFYKAFSSHSKSIEKFVKSNKLNIKKENDLAKIITYYNTLL